MKRGIFQWLHQKEWARKGWGEWGGEEHQCSSMTMQVLVINFIISFYIL